MSTISLDFPTISALALSGVLLALGLVVLLRDPRARLNRRFALAVLSIQGWILSIAFGLASSDPSHAAALGRLAFAFATTIPFALLRVFHAFPVPSVPSFDKLTRALAVLCAAFVLLSLTRFIVADARLDGPHVHFVYGSLYPAFSLYVLSCFSFAIYLLWTKVRAAVGLTKLQLRYLLLGILLGGAGVITTNLVIPFIWRTSRYSVLGPYFSLVMVSFCAHAIVRHRLLDIRVFVKRGVVYLIAVTSAATILTLVLWIPAGGSLYPLREVSLQLLVALALAVAIAFHPLKSWIQTRLDQYVYRSTYSYPDIIRAASAKISATLDTAALAAYLCDVVSRSMNPEAAAILLLDPTTQRFIAVQERSPFPGVITTPETTPEPLSAQSSLAAHLRRSRAPVVLDELILAPDDPTSTDIATSLIGLRAALVVPMLSEQHLNGLLIVGPKRSGDAYFADDLHLLTTLANQAAIAANNAYLYRQVRAANDYIRHILSTMDSAVISVDASGRVVMANDAAARLTAIPLSQLLLLSVAALPRPLSSQLEAALDDGLPRPQIESSLSLSQTLSVPMVSSSSALRADHGTVSGALIVFNDLSKVKELEAEKRRVERLASLGALASGMAHEIKNPLVAIRTFAELLPERFVDLEFRHDFSRVVMSEIDRIDALVDRLKGLAGPPPALRTELDLRDPITETVHLLRGRLDQTHIKVSYRFDDPAPRVIGDSAQLKQLFLNLLQNAIEAMGSGGSIEITITRQQQRDAERLTVELTDTGPGIPDSIRSSIFDPFFTTKSGGSGLGLAICRGIADAHRARVWAKPSAPGCGTTMSVDFPAIAVVAVSPDFREVPPPTPERTRESVGRQDA